MNNFIDNNVKIVKPKLYKGKYHVQKCRYQKS